MRRGKCCASTFIGTASIISSTIVFSFVEVQVVGGMDGNSLVNDTFRSFTEIIFERPYHCYYVTLHILKSTCMNSPLGSRVVTSLVRPRIVPNRGARAVVIGAKSLLKMRRHGSCQLCRRHAIGKRPIVGGTVTGLIRWK